jgi:hypothetical protein
MVRPVTSTGPIEPKVLPTYIRATQTDKNQIFRLDDQCVWRMGYDHRCTEGFDPCRYSLGSRGHDWGSSRSRVLARERTFRWASATRDAVPGVPR